MSVNRTLSLCSFNLHGFKNGFNTGRVLCKSFDLVLLQEHWLRKDNLPDLALLNENVSYFGISGMDVLLQEHWHGRCGLQWFIEG